MSIDVMSAVWKHSEHKGTDLLTLLSIADNASDDGFAYPGYDYIAAKTRMSKRAVQNVVKKLIASGELSLVAQGTQGRSNLYSINVAELRSKPVQVAKAATSEGGVSPELIPGGTQDATSGGNPGGNPGGTQRATEPSCIEPSGLEPIPLAATEAAATCRHCGRGQVDGLVCCEARAFELKGAAGPEGPAELTLPGMPSPTPVPQTTPSPSKKGSEPQVVPEVQEAWDYYVQTFPRSRKITGLTAPRIRTLSKALAAVDNDVSVLKAAMDGLKTYRLAHPDRSKDVSLDVMFSTGPHDRQNLTDKIEFWAEQSSGQSGMPSSVPSAHRSRVSELAVLALSMERQPDDGAVRERGLEAEMILRERFKVKVISDGKGKLIGWEAAS